MIRPLNKTNNPGVKRMSPAFTKKIEDLITEAAKEKTEAAATICRHLERAKSASKSSEPKK